MFNPPPPLSIRQPSTVLGWSLSSEGMLAVPLPPEHLWLKTSPPPREEPVPGGSSQEPGRKIACEAWDSYTNFLASKKLLRCRICQTPMATRMSVCRMDHHSTRWLVLSLVCRKRSSRHCRGNDSKSYSRTARATGFPACKDVPGPPTLQGLPSASTGR